MDCHECGTNFTMHEYCSIVVPRGLEPLYADCYRAFGWEATNVVNSLVSVSKVSLSFRRNRAIKNNVELSRLQAQLDGAFRNLQTIQAEKEAAGFVPALSMGIVSALVLGGGMSLCLKSDQLVLGVIVGLAGLAGCAFPYFIHKTIKEKHAERFIVAADEQYDKISQICSQAQALIR
jgi:hypothetical protein